MARMTCKVKASAGYQEQTCYQLVCLCIVTAAFIVTWLCSVHLRRLHTVTGLTSSIFSSPGQLTCAPEKLSVQV